ncbi:hypothetical protein [Mucilaginibacter panaciglaebae]|uniref:Uncharacterized protein n=1 Tax=Mucilaginibacter panaciglaebae TaxID=502331 RepID=A0ABP7WCR9_9SPHI
METLNIVLSSAQICLLNQFPPAIANLLSDLFQPGTNNYLKLVYELQREFKGGGSPDISRISFDRIKYDAATAKGSFRTLLDISFTFGCEDVTTDKPDQTSEWTFTVNPAEKNMTLFSSPFAESRSTVDEF